jgi:hypothetical protein
MLPKKSIQNRLGLGGDAGVEKLGQAPSRRAGVASADWATIDLRDRRKFAHRAGAEKFVGAVHFSE